MRQPATRPTRRAKAESGFYVNTIVGSEVTPAPAQADHIRQRRGDSHSYLWRVGRRNALTASSTDQRGKPLAVIGGFKGANTGIRLARPPCWVSRPHSGAAYVWFSRSRHSERRPTLSSDWTLNDNLTDAAQGRQIEPAGPSRACFPGADYGYVDARNRRRYGATVLDHQVC